MTHLANSPSISQASPSITEQIKRPLSVIWNICAALPGQHPTELSPVTSCHVGEASAGAERTWVQVPALPLLLLTSGKLIGSGPLSWEGGLTQLDPVGFREATLVHTDLSCLVNK